MHSQLGQDEWVLSKFPTGYFVDVGCYQAVYWSNTYLLEENGWKGIGIDPFPLFFESRKNTILEKAVIYDVENLDVEFALSDEYSGIVNDINLHKNKIEGKPREKFKTQLLANILEKHQAPNFIEYLSLDTEGSEYKILSTFPFDKYKFGCITVEHNFEEPRRQQIRDLLFKNGYILAKEAQWDDWFSSLEH